MTLASQARAVSHQRDLDAVSSVHVPARNPNWVPVAIVAAAMCVFVNVYLMWGATSPAFPFDEVHMLQMSRMLAGLEVPLVSGAGYFPGWSLILAPIWWVTQSPTAVYVTTLLVGIALALISAWPLSALLARFGITAAQAWTVAFLVMSFPSRAVQADFALAERLLFLLIVLAALCAYRLWESPSPVRAAALAAVTCAAYFTHARALTIVIVSAIYLVLFAFYRWRPALVGLLVLGMLFVIADRVGRVWNELLLGHPMDQSEGVFDSLSDTRASLLLRVTLGQAWNQVVGSFGLVVIGAVVLSVFAWRAVRRFKPEPTLWLAGAIVATAGLSIAAWSGNYNLQVNPWRRLDAWIYGRYLDPLAILLVAIGLAVVVRGLKRWVAATALTIQVGILAATLLLTAPTAATWGYVTPAHIPGVLPWSPLLPATPFSDEWLLPTFTNDNRFWLWASLCSLAIPLIVLFAKRAAVAVIGTLLVTVLASAVLSDPVTSEHHAEASVPPDMPALETALLAVPGASSAFDQACPSDGHLRAVARNLYGWWLTPTTMHITDTRNETAPDVDVLVGCSDWSEANARGAVPLGGQDSYGKTIWVLPGPVFDELERAGVLN